MGLLPQMHKFSLSLSVVFVVILNVIQNIDLSYSTTQLMAMSKILNLHGNLEVRKIGPLMLLHPRNIRCKKEKI